MGSFTDDQLGECRTRGQALADLVETLNKTGPNNPRLPMLARMIRQLAEEIAARPRQAIGPQACGGRPEAELVGAVRPFSR